MSASTGRPGQQQVLVRMPDDLHAALVVCADAEERSVAQTIRFLVRRYVAEQATIKEAP